MNARRLVLRSLLAAGLLAASLAETGAAQAQIAGGRLAERLREKRAEEGRPVDLQAISPGAYKQTQAYGPDAAQQLDVYVPPGARDAPVIVMVHGGAWKIGDKANTGSVENKLKHWLPQGYILVSVDYRMLPKAMAYEQAQDVAKALSWVQSHARGWGGDPDRIILMGHSAGAHLVALLSSRPEMVGRRWAGTVVLDSAAVNVSGVMARRHLGFYDEAFGQDPAYWTKASPMEQWTPAAVPMMLVCSTRRPDAPCDDAKAFKALAARSGRAMPVLPKNLTHAEINRTLGLAGDYTRAVDAFIAARLNGGA